MHTVKSNLVLRVEELVQEDLRQVPIVLKKNREDVSQSHEVSRREKLAEQVTPLIISRTGQKQPNYCVLRVQKPKHQSLLRKLLEQGRLQRETTDLREPVKLICLTLKKKLKKCKRKKGAKAQKEKQE